MAHYLWSPINLVVTDYGKVQKVAKVGEKVTADKLDMSQEDFDALVALGTIREQPYPDIPDNVAPSEHFRAMGVADTSDLSKDERKELEAFRAEAAKREAETQEKATTGGVTGKEGQGKPSAKG